MVMSQKEHQLSYPEHTTSLATNERAAWRLLLAGGSQHFSCLRQHARQSKMQGNVPINKHPLPARALFLSYSSAPCSIRPRAHAGAGRGEAAPATHMQLGLRQLREPEHVRQSLLGSIAASPHSLSLFTASLRHCVKSVFLLNHQHVQLEHLHYQNPPITIFRRRAELCLHSPFFCFLGSTNGF